MQQKNTSPQDHLQIDSQLSVSTLRCLNAKFINTLNTHSQFSLGKLQKTNSRSFEKQPKDEQKLENQENISALLMPDEEDLLFLADFQQEDSKSSSFTLTVDYQPINYTESVVINNQITTNSTYHSIAEESEQYFKSPPLRKVNDSPSIVLRKQSELKFDNGGVFKGYLKDGKMIAGTFVLNNTFTYKGELLNDKFHGQGTLIFHNGYTISSIWQQGRPTGNVTIRYPGGQRYEGELVDFKKHGIGCLYFIDGSRYVGEFKRGEITGQGCYCSANKEEKRGYWINGQFQGQIVSKCSSQIKNSSKQMKLHLLRGQHRQKIHIQ